MHEYPSLVALFLSADKVPHTVRMVIFQPRRENVSEYIVTRTELLQWAEDVLVPTAKLAFDGEGEFCAGEHCRFCKAKSAFFIKFNVDGLLRGDYASRMSGYANQSHEYSRRTAGWYH